MSSNAKPAGIKKGDVIDSFKPWMIVPLINSSFKLPDALPKVHEIQETGIFEHFFWDENPTVKSFSPSMLKTFLTSALQKRTIEGYTVVTALAVANAIKREVDKSKIKRVINEKELDLTEEEEELITEGWTVLKNSSWSWSLWLGLYDAVRQSVYLTSLQHPLAEYAKIVLPKLSLDELKQAYTLMHAADYVTIAVTCEDEHIFLYLAQAIQDAVEPIPVAFLLSNPMIQTSWMNSQLSCLPNCALDWNRTEEKLQIVALYDLLKDEELQISRVVEAETLDERQCLFKRRFHRACECTRCKIEEKGLRRIEVNQQDLVRMGHLAFRESRFDAALQYYRLVIQQEKNAEMPSAWSDSWHAIGAVLLAQKKFVEAQRHWQEAATKHPSLNKHHGIAQELAKQSAYGFLAKGDNQLKTVVDKVDENGSCTNNHQSLPRYTSYFNELCFLTTDPAVSQETCEWIISLVETSKNWTTNRHYAVPTNDVPVHHLNPLSSWFNKWMASTVYPLLEAQFNLEGNHFFVHDAFVVRYLASKSSKFLPIHVDESTHSLVLTLNSDFEGGGTYFFDYQTTLCPMRPGSLISFRGETLKHGGNAITKGVRYILAVFLYHDPSKEQKQKGRKRPLSLIRERDEKEQFSFDFKL
mmetsp:Transcript_26443/g.39109  ORF Transcript_26443/g.39109 Transcript_26443/m.39109 type:complete len:640 (-) Transcript_26443:174-2093(-)|eukprot:CAMPEP_0194223344 /NCGR_PEP_ID=MMETSP0156-20130528/34915_1 /TAXON_ID=33649 /ORGANISM="Thalassionema nitzschioides, Strain L26-B" /LENGTH=639 /DNA_ID=CAMNT_0038954451 /DNA_START=99 /DNA_END=2018 /DNA_ORIENTATION=+